MRLDELLIQRPDSEAALALIFALEHVGLGGLELDTSDRVAFDGDVNDPVIRRWYYHHGDSYISTWEYHGIAQGAHRFRWFFGAQGGFRKRWDTIWLPATTDPLR